jgi:hypothetical protein
MLVLGLTDQTGNQAGNLLWVCAAVAARTAEITLPAATGSRPGDASPRTGNPYPAAPSRPANPY